MPKDDTPLMFNKRNRRILKERLEATSLSSEDLHAQASKEIGNFLDLIEASEKKDEYIRRLERKLGYYGIAYPKKPGGLNGNKEES